MNNKNNHCSGLEVCIEWMSYKPQNSNGRIIDDFQFCFKESETVALLGPSGAGKTTLLRIIAGFEDRYNGHVHYDGVPLQHPNPSIQLVFQDYRLIPWKSVLENLQFFSLSSKISRKTAKKMLEDFSLHCDLDSYPKDLSGGEKSRLAFMRAFLNMPKILLILKQWSITPMVAPQSFPKKIFLKKKLMIA